MTVAGTVDGVAASTAGSSSETREKGAVRRTCMASAGEAACESRPRQLS